MIDFGKSKSGQEWYPLVDGVMGGLSTGKIELTDNTLLFKGSVSLENNGGFSSIRNPFQRQDLSEYSSVEIRYRGVDQKFAFTMETSQTWWRPYYKYQLPSSEEWKVLEIPLEEFKQYAVGRYQGRSLERSQLDKIIRLGIITDSKNTGPFEFELDYITFKK